MGVQALSMVHATMMVLGTVIVGGHVEDVGDGRVTTLRRCREG